MYIQIVLIMNQRRPLELWGNEHHVKDKSVCYCIAKQIILISSLVRWPSPSREQLTPSDVCVQMQCAPFSPPTDRLGRARFDECLVFDEHII